MTIREKSRIYSGWLAVQLMKDGANIFMAIESAASVVLSYSDEEINDWYEKTGKHLDAKNPEETLNIVSSTELLDENRREARIQKRRKMKRLIQNGQQAID